MSRCEVKVKCRVESCGMRHHTLVHEVDKRFIERAKAKKQEHGTAKSPPPPPPPPTNEHNVGFYGKTGYYGKGQALVEVLPVVFYGKNWEKQTVIVLRDNGCNTTLMDEELAVELGLEGREIGL